MPYRELDRLVPGWRQLREASRTVRDRAYCPYSKYAVGAALVDSEGRIAAGCNVENASYGLTICAERSAVCSAIANNLSKPVVLCVSLTGVPVPCGACRQFLYEFNPDLLLLLDDLNQPDGCAPELVRLSDMLPRAFRLEVE